MGDTAWMMLLPLLHGTSALSLLSPTPPRTTPTPTTRAQETVTNRPQPRRPNVSSTREEEGLKVGWLVFALALLGCGVFYSLAKDIRAPTPTPPEAVKVDIPAPKAKGRIPSDREVGEVEGKPELKHTDITDVALGDDLVWSVQVSGSNAYDKVQVWYRPQGTDSWSKSTLRKTREGYKGRIAVDRMMGAGVEYWIEAKPYRKGLPNLTHGSENRPVRVFVH